jgi:hypothetical protein
LLPDKEALAIIKEIEDSQLIILLLNLPWFLAFQIEWSKLIKAAIMTILHWGDQFKSQIFHISSMDVNWNTILYTSCFYGDCIHNPSSFLSQGSSISFILVSSLILHLQTFMRTCLDFQILRHYAMHSTKTIWSK